MYGVKSNLGCTDQEYKETPTCISKQIIWKNSYIKCDNNIIYYKEFTLHAVKGIKYIEHIYDYRSNIFYIFNNLQNLYDLNTTDFLKQPSNY